MKEIYWRLFATLLVAIVILSCESKMQEADGNHTAHNHEASDSAQNKLGKTLYYCPMDTQIIQNIPGICSICKMELVLKKRTTSVEEEWVYKPVNTIVLSSTKTLKPVFKTVPLVISVNGYISYDTKRVYSISSKIDGRIEKLNVKYTYQPVSKGQPLLEIYSHDLQIAQQEYKYIKNNNGDESLIVAAKNKLLQLGMTESQINKISVASSVSPVTLIYCPYTGYIIQTDKENNNSEKSSGSMDSEKMDNTSETKSKQGALLREGSYVKKGEPLFKVANTDIVWGIFEAFSSHQKILKIGQPLYVTVGHTGSILKGKIDFIEPDFKEKAETVRFRVFMDNKEGHLKIGNLLKGEIKTDNNRGLWIPKSAILDLGKEQVVFVKKDHAFEVKKVVTGVFSEQEILIIEGLNESDEIAQNAQFMIDSESFIKAKK